MPTIEVTPYSVMERGYSALEREMVSLMCQASSNPPSQYVWFYNNSQVHVGQTLTITKIPRTRSGHYTCMAQNTNLNTRSTTSISLSVYCESIKLYVSPVSLFFICLVVMYICSIMYSSLKLYILNARNQG